MAKCPQCKSIQSIKASFCPNCGAQLPEFIWRQVPNYKPDVKNSEFYQSLMNIFNEERISEYKDLEPGFEINKDFLTSHPDLQFAEKTVNTILHRPAYRSEGFLLYENALQKYLYIFNAHFFKKKDVVPYEIAIRFDENYSERFWQYKKDIDNILEAENIHCFVNVDNKETELCISILGFEQCFKETELGFIPPYVKYMLSNLNFCFFSYLRLYEEEEYDLGKDAASGYIYIQTQ